MSAAAAVIPAGGVVLPGVPVHHDNVLQTLGHGIGKVFTFLGHLGQQTEKGIELVSPYLGDIAALISIANPVLGAAFLATGKTVVLVEQKFSAIGKQSGTGAQKAAEVFAVAGSVVESALRQGGHASAEADVKKYIDYIVSVLNRPLADVVAPALPA